MRNDDNEQSRCSFADYNILVDDSVSKKSERMMSQITPLRDEIDVQNDPSHRRTSIYFEEDATTLPSRSDEYMMNNQEPLLYVPQREPSALNSVNYLNVVTYGAHLFVSWGIGIWGLDGKLSTRWEITQEFETLVTPAEWAYFLWVPILILEGIFALAQLTPHYRNRPIIQAGTGYFFFYCFVLQTAWTFFFSFELFTLSFISVVLALLSLLSLLLSQLHTISNDERRSWLEYLLFRFPFYLHTGWMVLMSTDHFALLFRAFGTSAHVQAAIDILSLSVLLAVGVACLIRPPYSDFVIPTVILWCFVSIRLSHLKLAGNLVLTFVLSISPLVLRLELVVDLRIPAKKCSLCMGTLLFWRFAIQRISWPVYLAAALRPVLWFGLHANSARSESLSWI